MSSRTDDDPEGGELAQLMRSLGEGAENGTAVRYEKGDKVDTLSSCTFQAVCTSSCCQSLSATPHDIGRARQCVRNTVVYL